MVGTITKVGIIKEGSFWNALGESGRGDFPKMPKVGEPFIFNGREPWYTSIVKDIEEESENVLIITTTYSVYELTIELDD
jgi:hypothetical protein